MHAQVLRSLHIGHASLLDQAHSLKLEFPRKLPSLHDPPPAPSKHLTRCLRNRVQANMPESKTEALARAITRYMARTLVRGRTDLDELDALHQAFNDALN